MLGILCTSNVEKLMQQSCIELVKNYQVIHLGMVTPAPSAPFIRAKILNLFSRENFSLLHFVLLSQQVVPEFTARLAPQIEKISKCIIVENI
jgi:hypothetical protein